MDCERFRTPFNLNEPAARCVAPSIRGGRHDRSSQSPQLGQSGRSRSYARPVSRVWASARAAPENKTLRFIAQADLRILDPIWTTAYITRNHGYMVFDTLFAIDSEFMP